MSYDNRTPRPGVLKVCIYTILTGGLYFFWWFVKTLSGGYR